MTARKLTERERLAWQHHQCGYRYEGPCWGPTTDDYAWADAQIAVGVEGDKPSNARANDFGALLSVPVDPT